MARKISINLEADGAKFSTALDTAKKQATAFVSDVNTKAKESSLSFGQQLRARAIEERQSGNKQIESLLGGNLAILGGAGIALHFVDEYAKKIVDLRKELREGKIDQTQFYGEAVKAIPLIGSLFSIGENIGNAILGGETTEELVEKFKKINEAREKLSKVSDKFDERTLSLAYDTAITGASTLEKINLRNVKATADAAIEVEKFRAEMKAAGADANTIGTRVNELSDRLEVNNLEKYTEALKEYQRAKAEAFDGARNNLSDKHDDLQVLFAKNRGDDVAAHNAEITASLNKATRATDEWKQKMIESYPAAAGVIAFYASALKALDRQQADLQRSLPLNNALNQIQKEFDNSKFKNSIDERIDGLRKMFATEQEIAKYRLLLQITTDREAAKGIVESTRTPIEAFLKQKKELDRMRDDEAIDNDTYQRALGDAADKARHELGLDKPLKTVSAEEYRGTFNVPSQPQLADPISKLANVQTSTLRVAEKQVELLEKLGEKAIALFKIGA